jgi:hypothetical protein
MLQDCSWPQLSERYDKALREAVEFILTRFKPIGIVATGSIIRGNPDSTSDLDIEVIHDARYRQRIQKFFNNVPAEIFVNPLSSIERYLVQERAEGRPSTAHMIATGFVILEKDSTVALIRQKAMAILAERPVYSEERLKRSHYGAATIYEDAIDVIKTDPVTANMLLAQAVREMLHYYFLSSNRFIPRHKELIATINGLDGELGDKVKRFFNEGDADLRSDLAGKIADQTIGVRGFYEWESSQEEIKD